MFSSRTGLICNTCRKHILGNGFQRKSKHRLLHFCSLECNVKNIEGNVRDAAGERLLQEAKDQLEESKWPKEEAGLRRYKRQMVREAVERSQHKEELELK